MKTFRLESEVGNKDELLDAIANLVAKDANCSNQEIKKDLLKRESEYSTGLENGFAIPHCRTKQVSEPYIVIGNLLNHLTDYKTLDQKPVEFIISFIVPDDVSGEKEHLKLLSGIMRKLVNKENQELIKKTSDLIEIKKILEI